MCRLPFNTTLQLEFIEALAASLDINVGLVHFIKATTSNPITTTGRRLLDLEVAALKPSRSFPDTVLELP